MNAWKSYGQSVVDGDLQRTEKLVQDAIAMAVACRTHSQRGLDPRLAEVAGCLNAVSSYVQKC